MLHSIWEDVKRQFSYGNKVTQLIIVNVAVFVLINLVMLILYIGNGAELPEIFNTIVRTLSLSSDWKVLITSPWSIITHMFLHTDPFHILWNMLYLYWFGRIVSDFIGNQRIVPIYLLGGLAGGILYLASASFLPGVGLYALGASAGVMAITLAAGAIAPNYEMNLIFIGPVKLKYIVTVLLFLDLIAIPKGGNTGGHVAHIGGALMGWLFIFQLQNGNDLSKPINGFFNWVASLFDRKKRQSKRSKAKVAYKNPNVKRAKTTAAVHVKNSKGNANMDYSSMSHQERVDAILDKIKLTGYDSLSKEEREYLFKASKQD
jgi:membrane associated rhomboid family serine protease